MSHPYPLPPPAPAAPPERRTASRVHYTGGLLPPALRIRPGRDVIIVNLASGGTLVESRWRFRPGSMVDVLLHQPRSPIRPACAIAPPCASKQPSRSTCRAP
jgi:hypothetical protein